MLCFALVGCNYDGVSDSLGTSQDDRLTMIAKQINASDMPFAGEEFNLLTPMEKGRVFDLLSDIRGKSDDGFYVSVEQVEQLSAQYFGVAFEELSYNNKEFVVAEVFGGTDHPFFDAYVSDDGYVEMASHGLVRWVVKKVQKVLGRSAAKKTGYYLNECDVPKGFFWFVVDKVPVVGWALVPCIAR